MPRHLGAIQAAQAAGQIGQQQTGEPVAADYPGHPSDQRQGTELHGERSNQHTQAHPAYPQGAQQRAALLQRQADGGMDDEQPDDEGQQAEGAEVEVETVGQAGQIGGLAALAQLQLAGQILGQLPSKVLAYQHPRQPLRCAEQPLGDADIHQQHAGRQLRTHFQRRQRRAGLVERLLAGAEAKVGQGIGGDQGAAGRAEEARQVLALDRRTGWGGGRQSHRLDADQLQAMRGLALQAHTALQQRRDRPAGAAQFDEVVLREQSAIAGDQHLLLRPAEQTLDPRVAVAGLGVQRLHAGPQRGRQPQPGEHAEELRGMPPPMAGQPAQGPQQQAHLRARPVRAECRCATPPDAPGARPCAGYG
ncbi:hypothetical protein D3C76_633880 [compost metagenome]